LAHPGSSWPCCDNCGVCNKKFPPECQCNDISARGCHPECKKCVKNKFTVPPGGGPGPVVTYTCADVLTNFCQRRCTPAPAPPPKAFVGGVF
jgi:hypothetical protein